MFANIDKRHDDLKTEFFINHQQVTTIYLIDANQQL